jgi:hypothetical protein
VTGDDYRSLWILAGAWRDKADPTPYLLTHGARGLPERGPAIYLAEATDGSIDYVGSTVSGARGRIRAHLHELPKARSWRAIWLIPLAEGCPEATVRRLEGRIGRRLAPPGNRRLPLAVGP